MSTPSQLMRDLSALDDPSIEAEVDGLLSRTPAGVAAHFFPAPRSVVDGIRGTYYEYETPRQAYVLAALLARLLETRVKTDV